MAWHNVAEKVEEEVEKEPNFAEKRKKWIQNQKEGMQRNEKFVRTLKKQQGSVFSYKTESAEDTPKDQGCMSNITPFILMIGLGVHAVCEGMAVGAEGRSAKVLILSLAIILHKGAAAMSFGISLKNAFNDR